MISLQSARLRSQFNLWAQGNFARRGEVSLSHLANTLDYSKNVTFTTAINIDKTIFRLVSDSKCHLTSQGLIICCLHYKIGE